MSEELIEVKPEFMGFQNGDYPGAFPPKVDERIRKIVASPCLHLFSGSSKIGDVRVDLTHPNATDHIDVFKFVRTDGRDWKFVLLDPPYPMSQRNTEKMSYARHDTFPWASKFLRCWSGGSHISIWSISAFSGFSKGRSPIMHHWRN